MDSKVQAIVDTKVDGEDEKEDAENINVTDADGLNKSASQN